MDLIQAELLEQAAAAPEDQGLLWTLRARGHGPQVVTDGASLVSARVVEQFFAAHVAPVVQAESLA